MIASFKLSDFQPFLCNYLQFCKPLNKRNPINSQLVCSFFEAWSDLIELNP